MGSDKERPIPLFTSLPPSMSRLDSNGSEIGPAYAQACLESWVDSGFFPISLNSQSEEILHPEKRDAIDMRTLSRDANDQFGKPLPFLSDILEEMRNSQPGIVALVNSDIFLNFSSEDKFRLQNLKPGECVVAKREDISSIEARSGTEFPYGYDFFAFHTCDIPSLKSDSFVLGKPWWDHFLPLCFLLRGMRSVNLSQDSVLHLLHDERWVPGDYIFIGDKFSDEIKEQRNYLPFDGSFGRNYISELERLTRKKGVLRAFEFGFAKRFMYKSDLKTISSLRQMGRLNRQAIEAWRQSAE